MHSQRPATSLLHRIITPYNADAYDQFLHQFNLTTRYPNLVFNLRNGFPIGDMPPLKRTYTPQNHPSALQQSHIIRSYLDEEVHLGRMSGPFLQDEVELIIGGHFIVCPLGLVEKAGEPGKFRVVRDLSYRQKADGYSVNEHLDADDFPTEWGTAAQVADIVSLSEFNHQIYFQGACFCTHCLHTPFFTAHIYTSNSTITTSSHFRDSRLHFTIFHTFTRAMRQFQNSHIIHGLIPSIRLHQHPQACKPPHLMSKPHTGPSQYGHLTNVFSWWA
jgi:hypothetical protein